MALAQDENMETRSYSLSSQLMAERDAYYQVLEHTSKHDGDITQWLQWLLGCMSRAILSANRLFCPTSCKRLASGGEYDQPFANCVCFHGFPPFSLIRLNVS